MRKYAIISNNSNYKKIIIAKLVSDYLVFLYDSEEDVFSIVSKRYSNIEGLNNYINTIDGDIQEWTEIDDPLEFCNYDLITPSRLFGRDKEKPNADGLWQRYIDNEWKLYLVGDDGNWKLID